MFRFVKRFFVGSPLSNSQMEHETMNKKKAIAIFASDALSSVAYASEEITLVLALYGVVAMSWLLPISLGIIALLILVVLSYRHVIRVYSSGGGSYVVAKENLGENYGLVAGASLLIDYLLTVSVSISSGTAAITSAFPQLLDYKVGIAVFFIIILTVINLRGISESSNILAYPPYLFILSMGMLVAVGLGRYYLYGAPPVLPVQELHPVATGFGLFAGLRAFSGGCTALTGVEAVSNGVPAFKEPKAHNAILVLFALGGLAIFLFGGASLVAQLYGVVPVHGETLLSQVAVQAFGGRGWAYYFLQGTTALILILAANTSYNGAPLLASRLAADGYLPRLLAIRGDRLVFSNGIILLGIVASLLVIIFKGNTHSLIPLYAVGVFLSFTLSQFGMVRHWWVTKDKGWRFNALINLTGAIVTGVVTLVIGITKFTHGAWIVIVIIPIMVMIFRAIAGHYRAVAKELSTAEGIKPRIIHKHTIIVPLASLTNVVANTIEYAKSLSPNVIGVYVNMNEEAAAKLKKKWEQYESDVELVMLESPYRSVLGPLIDYIDQIERTSQQNELITVLVPEFVTRKWWHYFLHNQTGFMLRTALLLRKDIVVSSVPYHLSN